MATVTNYDVLQIAPSRHGGYWTGDDWDALDLGNEEDWQIAVDIFEDRIRDQFLYVTEEIQQYEHAGFAIMVLDCLLIETLQQFFDGKHSKFSWSSRDFRKFLTSRNCRFRDFFDSSTADKFSEQIRSGILDEAKLKGNSRITLTESTPLVRQVDGGLVINGLLFHQELVGEFNHYVVRLRCNEPVNRSLRGNFIKKMGKLCEK